MQGRYLQPFRFAIKKADTKEAERYKPVSANQSARNMFRHHINPPKLAAAAQSGKMIPASRHEPGTRFRQHASLRWLRIAATFQKPYWRYCHANSDKVTLGRYQEIILGDCQINPPVETSRRFNS